MAQLNSKLESLLTQRAFSTLCELHNLSDGRLRLRMSAQLFHIRFGVFAAYRLFRPSRLLCFLRHFLFLDLWRGLLPQISSAATFCSLTCPPSGASSCPHAQAVRPNPIFTWYAWPNASRFATTSMRCARASSLRSAWLPRLRSTTKVVPQQDEAQPLSQRLSPRTCGG